MFGRMGPWEIALIVIIILIVFGVGKLPQVGGAMGKAIRSFKAGQKGDLDEDEEEEEEEEKPRARAVVSKSTGTRKRKTKAKS